MLEELLGFDLGAVFAQIGQLVYEPSSNVLASSLLLAAFIVVLGILLTAAILFVLAARRRHEEAEAQGALELAVNEADIELDERTYDPLSARLRVLLLFVALLAGLWVVTGVSTSSVEVCTSCHTDPHARLEEGLPHADLTCVQCHEPGGGVQSATISVPSRLVHVVQGIRGLGELSEYGRVDSSSCRTCHEEIVTTTTENERRGIRVSHLEPIEAGARCIECHRPNTEGVISGAYGGMNTCLRCHDGVQASTECTLCHTKDVGYSAIADHLPSPLTARVLVTEPLTKCYECHDPRPCDSCHGMRIPHGDDFVGRGHAYEGVKSIWAGSNGSCVACHTPQRRSCSSQGCHGSEFPYHYTLDPDFPTSHATGRWVRTGPNRLNPSVLGCSTCHTRDICTWCHAQRDPLPFTPPGSSPDASLDEED